MNTASFLYCVFFPAVSVCVCACVRTYYTALPLSWACAGTQQANMGSDKHMSWRTVSE